MLLIGQYDSPFLRRVGIALTLYERQRLPAYKAIQQPFIAPVQRKAQ